MDAKTRAIKAFTRFHEFVYRASKGKLLGRGSGMPVVMLTTTGRKSGEPRTTMLTTPLQIGDAVVLVASNNGGDKDPAWLLNLRENPKVELVIGGRSSPMTARVADAAEKAELWPRILTDHANYGAYQDKTERDIPVVVLEP